MTGSIRVRPPINADPPEFTVEFYSVGFGEGLWMVLRNGVEVSTHDWKWQAKRAAKRAAKRDAA